MLRIFNLPKLKNVAIREILMEAAIMQSAEYWNSLLHNNLF